MLRNRVHRTFLYTFLESLLKIFLLKVLRYEVFLSNTNNLHIVIWLHVFISNINMCMV